MIKQDDKYLTMEDQDRRIFMTKMAGLFGAATATTILSGCNITSAKQFADQRPHPPSDNTLFSKHEMTLLYAICDTILPRTDTPSATELDCHNFVQYQLTQCHTQQQQQDCIAVINKIERIASQNKGNSFALLSIEQQQQLLVNVEKADSFNDQDKNQFHFLKALIVFGYFTTEIGATQALSYQAVPGGFKGSIPADKKTKSWGSLVYY